MGLQIIIINIGLLCSPFLSSGGPFVETCPFEKLEDVRIFHMQMIVSYWPSHTLCRVDHLMDDDQTEREKEC